MASAAGENERVHLASGDDGETKVAVVWGVRRGCDGVPHGAASEDVICVVAFEIPYSPCLVLLRKCT
jgi:hypothetical protein